MLDAPTNSLKLVEYNTIASSLSSHCQRVRELQNYILDKYSAQLSQYKNYNDDWQYTDFLSYQNIEKVAESFFRACEWYSEERRKKYPELPTNDTSKYWVLFVIDENERNICDQKWIEIESYEKFRVRSMRLTLQEVHKRVKKDKDRGTLLIDGMLEIALVYYRTGY